MKSIHWCVLMMLLTAARAPQAQTFNDVQIELGAYTLSGQGGEKPLGVWRSTGPITIGTTTNSTFSVGESCDAFLVSSRRSLVDNAATAWRVDVTPVRVAGDTVTFRLQWMRMASLQQQLDQLPTATLKTFKAASGDIELTLRPGESWPIETLRGRSDDKSGDGPTCRGGGAVIRVQVDNYPSETVDRRLVAADLWLIERLGSGAEAPRGQVAARGQPNRPFPFYFDSVVDATIALDIYGTLVARLEDGTMAVSIEARSRWGDPSDAHAFSGPGRSVQSVIKVKPSEVVEIPLPRLGDRAGPFAKREFAIRIRARQLR